MTTIYGLRRIGDAEVRYIGRTNKPLRIRLHKHILNAARNYPPKISAWIREAVDVEIIPIANCSQEAACREERRFVEEYHALGHRLTNCHLLSPIIAQARRTGVAA